MAKKLIFIKILALVGTLLVWLPLLAPILFSLIFLGTDHQLRFDYLMPAELFPIAFLGGGLLILSSLLKRLYQKLICLSFSLSLGFLILGQVLAVVTGLASGTIEPQGWPWFLVLFSLLVNIFALLATGIGGLLLLRQLFPISPEKS